MSEEHESGGQEAPVSVWSREGLRALVWVLLPDLVFLVCCTVAVALAAVFMGSRLNQKTVVDFGVVIAAFGVLLAGLLLSLQERWNRKQQLELVEFSELIRQYAVENIEPLRRDLDILKDVPDDKPPEKVPTASARGVEKPLGIRERNAYLNIIGALVELVRTPRPGRDSDAAVIRELIENYGDKPGISKSNLETKFAEAKRAITSD